MDTRFLESLVTVAESGSMAEAARRLNLTPAGIAQRIRALEGEVGARLLLRSGRAMRPTQAAAAVLERARRLLADVRDLKSIAASGELSGELRLGVMQTSLLGLFSDALIPFTRAHPRIEVKIVRDHSARLYEKVVSAEVDAAVISEPPFAIPKACEWLLLREEPFVVLTPASLKVRDAHAALTQEPFIRLDRNVFAGKLIDGYLRKVGIRPKERRQAADAPTREMGMYFVPAGGCPWLRQ